MSNKSSIHHIRYGICFASFAGAFTVYIRAEIAICLFVRFEIYDCAAKVRAYSCCERTIAVRDGADDAEVELDLGPDVCDGRVHCGCSRVYLFVEEV